MENYMPTTNSLRPAWVIANQGKRLVNIETGTYLEQSVVSNQTTAHSVHGEATIGTIDQPLDKIIKAMTKQGLVLKLF
jgi:hypothetical protein